VCFAAPSGKLLLVKTLGTHFDPAMGRPTKVLYSMAGRVFVLELFRHFSPNATVNLHQVSAMSAIQFVPRSKPRLSLHVASRFGAVG
jgi:hypothetical protein